LGFSLRKRSFDMERKNNILYVVLLSAVILISSVTYANTVDISHAGYQANSSVQVWGAGLSGEWVKGGVSVLDKTASTGPGNFWENGDIFAFCIEMSESSSENKYTYDVVTHDQAHKPITILGDIIGTEKAEYISELWARYYNPAWTNVGPFDFEYNHQAEAFAACLWEIIYEDIPDTPLGWNVTTDGTTGDLGFNCLSLYYEGDLANSWLHSLTGCGPRAELMAFVREGSQDFLVEVPEPATICIFGFGMLAMLRKRKKV
jgi:hypothetical protein